MTGAATTLLVVKTPAHSTGLSAQIKAKSSFPDFFIPALQAAALNPFGIANTDSAMVQLHMGCIVGKRRPIEVSSSSTGTRKFHPASGAKLPGMLPGRRQYREVFQHSDSPVENIFEKYLRQE
jgi:hypothetical protein